MDLLPASKLKIKVIVDLWPNENTSWKIATPSRVHARLYIQDAYQAGAYVEKYYGKNPEDPNFLLKWISSFKNELEQIKLTEIQNIYLNTFS